MALHTYNVEGMEINVVLVGGVFDEFFTITCDIVIMNLNKTTIL